MTADKTKAFLELCRRDPMLWRENLVMDGGHGKALFSEIMSAVQRRDFEAIDPALKYLCGTDEYKRRINAQVEAGTYKLIQKHYRQRGRGGSKSTDAGIDTIWALVFSPRKYQMICVAEDKDQATFVRDKIEEVCQFNPWLRHFITVYKDKVVNKQNESTLHVLTSDLLSSFGETPHMTIADEWTHWSQERLWNQVFTSWFKTKRFGGILLVNCNAGMGRDWKWELRTGWENDNSWYFSAPQGAPSWYSPEDVEEQKKGVTPADFKRLVLNEWVDGGGEFITLEEADECIDPNLHIRDKAEVDGWTYIASIDYAEKIDRCVGVVGHVYAGDVIIDRMDVVDPKTCGGSIPVSWVEQWIQEIEQRFGGQDGHVVFVVDRHQLVSTIQRLTESNYDIVEFEFAGGKGNYLLSRNLLQLIQQRRLRWYPGCGTIYDEHGNQFEEHKGRNDLSTELASLTVRTLPAGMWRLDHPPGSHDDRAFAVGALCLHVVQNCGGFGDWEITPPTKQGGFRIGA